MKPMLSISLLCLLAVGAGPTAVSQELPSFEEVLGKIAGVLDSEKAWTADTEMTMNMMGIAIKLEGSMTVSGSMSASTLKMDLMGMTMEMNTVIDAEGIQWTYTNVNGLEQVIKMDTTIVGEMGAGLADMTNPMGGMFMNESKDSLALLEMYDASFDMKVSGVETLEGVEVYVVEGEMKAGSTLDAEMQEMAAGLMAMLGGGDTSFMSPVKIAVGVHDGIVRSMSMGVANGKPLMVRTTKNVKRGIEVDASTFVFTPPEGAQVMDLAEMMEAGLRGPESAEEPEYNSKLKVGDTAPDFVGKAPDGSAVKLSDYKGKVVLLDFWATWCGPCVAELPNVIETYEKYHAKGLEIIGISLDNEQEALDEFVAKHSGMTWAQVFDGEGWGSSVGKDYGVDAIPFTLLLDGAGIIVARDLRGKALGEAVAELLAETE